MDLYLDNSSWLLSGYHFYILSPSFKRNANHILGQKFSFGQRNSLCNMIFAILYKEADFCLLLGICLSLGVIRWIHFFILRPSFKRNTSHNMGQKFSFGQNKSLYTMKFAIFYKKADFSLLLGICPSLGVNRWIQFSFLSPFFRRNISPKGTSKNYVDKRR